MGNIDTSGVEAALVVVPVPTAAAWVTEGTSVAHSHEIAWTASTLISNRRVASRLCSWLSVASFPLTTLSLRNEFT